MSMGFANGKVANLFAWHQRNLNTYFSDIICYILDDAEETTRKDSPDFWISQGQIQCPRSSLRETVCQLT